MGGEESFPILTACLIQGLPPRGRGRGIVAVPSRPAFGITPAWAGKSITPIIQLFHVKDYPRVGGEEAAIG